MLFSVSFTHVGRRHLASRLWLNLLENSFILCAFYLYRYTADGCGSYNSHLHCQVAGMKELMMSGKKIECALFCVFLLGISWNFENIAIFYLWVKAIKAMPLLNTFNPVILWRIDIKKKTTTKNRNAKQLNLKN